MMLNRAIFHSTEYVKKECLSCNLPGYSKNRGNLLERGEGVVSALLGPLLCLCGLTPFKGFHSAFTDVALALMCVCVLPSNG